MNKYILLLFVIIVGFTVSDVQKEFIELSWQENSGIIENNARVFFRNSDFLEGETQSELPVYTRLYNVESSGKTLRFCVDNPVFEKVDTVLESNILEKIPSELTFSSQMLKSGEDYKVEFQIIPLKKENGNVFKLKSFYLRVASDIYQKSTKTINWETSSALASGTWVKIKTSGKGIYKITYSNLSSWGFSNPENVGVFGNGGEIQSENPGEITYDDLEQCAVWTEDDCLFFYAPGVTSWETNSSGFLVHETNEYTSSGYFFLGETDNQKNPETLSEATGNATYSTSVADACDLIEEDEENLISSGKQWFGDSYSNGSSRSYSFDIDDPADDVDAKIRIQGAARSTASSKFVVTANSSEVGSVAFSSVTTTSSEGAYAAASNKTFDVESAGSNLPVTINYSASNNSAEAWLDYIELNYRRELKVNSTPLFFCDTKTVGTGNVVEYKISDAGSSTKVLEISDVNNVAEVETELSGTELTFKQDADELKKYVVFNTSGDFNVPEYVENVENQDLHSLSVPEFLILTHSDFASYADELADFHRDYDDMDVEVVDVDKVYNEFSSGSPSATGIRNFIKMLYDKNDGLKYVLLFGDGSYDNRGIQDDVNNFIPTYQSEESLYQAKSYVSDDYFVMLDAGEILKTGLIDLGIGRITVSSSLEAEVVVNKIKNYYSADALGDWRNVLCFIADDGGDSDPTPSEHESNSEKLSDFIEANHSEYVIDKIYLDAYSEESTTAGDRYPDVNDAIDERIEDGVLVVNYVGHANEKALADEKVVTVSTINSWTNANKLPIWVTASCEFSCFDGDETSAGEYVLLNENGGGIGLFSTTRIVYSGGNYTLNESFYNYIFEEDENGDHYRMGDVIRLAKINIGTGINKRKFMLIADPALMLSFPKYNIETSTVNEESAGVAMDTFGALQKITIAGNVVDYEGNIVTDFNGDVTHTVYDKEEDVQTLGNGDNIVFEYQVQNNIIYTGTSTVANGEFSFSFVIPKDISYEVGTGRIIYYASDGEEEDANGSFTNFCIGGETSDIVDNEGPDIQLYMNSESFNSGDETSANPTLLAYLSDENGINTVGTGIGHDITAVIDGDYTNILVLNNYYQANKDDYTSGVLEYALSDLDVGEHTLTLKAWDVANNSSEAEIEFEVTGDLIIESVSNYPNPMSDYTYFIVTHNQSGADLKAVFSIYDINGRCVDEFEEDLTSSGSTTTPVRWDLTDAKVAVGQGVYIYNVFIQNDDGVVASKAGKILVAK